MIEEKRLNMRQAGFYLGRSYRWMQRHWVNLVKSGVKVFRVPKDSVKGHILFEKDSLDKYLDSCQIKGDFDVL
jgi:hypothetical protein